MGNPASALQVPLACDNCRGDLAEAFRKDGQDPKKAEDARAVVHAAYCRRCALLMATAARLDFPDERTQELYQLDACPRCRTLFGAPREAGMAPMPEVFVKAICWAYLCED